MGIPATDKGAIRRDTVMPAVSRSCAVSPVYESYPVPATARVLHKGLLIVHDDRDHAGVVNVSQSSRVDHLVGAGEPPYPLCND